MTFGGITNLIAVIELVVVAFTVRVNSCEEETTLVTGFINTCA
jgi:hypothetical protein